MRVILITATLFIAVLLSACSSNSKEARCNTLFDAIIAKQRAKVAKIPENRRAMATQFLKVFESNKERFIKTCLTKSDAQIKQSFKEVNKSR